MTYRSRTNQRLRSLPSATLAVRTSWIAWVASLAVTRKAA